MISAKINIFDVVKGHFATFIDAGARAPKISDIITFLGAPLLLGIAVWYSNWVISDSTINILVTIFSIFAGFLINLLVLFFSISQSNRVFTDPKIGVVPDVIKHQSIVMDQTLSNISFALIQSIVIVLSLLMTTVLEISGPFRLFLSAFISFISFNFILNLLMIIKRIYIVISIKS